MRPTEDIEEICGASLPTRVATELASALRRRPTSEGRLASAIHVLIPHSGRLAEESVAALDVVVRRGTLDRPLYGAMLRGLLERGDERVAVPLLQALSRDDAGGLVTVTAAALSKDARLGEQLGRLVGCRSSHLAFAAELARVARGESNGKDLASLALRIKESHRLELFSQMLLPLIRNGGSIAGAAEALTILRDTERHLGRWLCLAEGARLAGDADVAERARSHLNSGAPSARAAWSLLAWALGPKDVACSTRPNLDLIARLSDRPSAERELSFLFRMAEAGQTSAKSMLSSLVKESTLDGEAAIRAAIYLIADHGQRELTRRLVEVAKSPKRENLRGLALAALHDVDPGLLAGLTLDLDRSRHLPTAVWSALLRQHLARSSRERLLTEARFRRLQYAWSD